jgi:hypothetical protein
MNVIGSGNPVLGSGNHSLGVGIKEYLQICEKFFRELIDKKIADDEEILFGILQNSLNKNDFKNKKNINNKENIMNGCKSIIKSGNRKGEECGKKVFSIGNEEFEYCVKHINSKKEELQGPGPGIKEHVYVSNKEDINSEELVIKKNNFGNFVFGQSGLIIKSAKEKYVVAKEGKNGEWNPLEEKDILMCKKFHLRYKIIDFTFKGETTNTEIIKNIEVYNINNKEKPKIEREIDFFETIENEEFKD